MTETSITTSELDGSLRQDSAHVLGRASLAETRGLSRERLAAMVAGRPFAASAWIQSRKIPPRPTVYREFEDSPFGANVFYNDETAQAAAVPSAEDLRTYSRNGISEVVTVSPVEGSTGDSPQSVLSYSTATMDRSPFRYKDGIGRPGNQFAYRLIVPTQDAETIVAAGKEDPRVFREVGDIIMHDSVGAGPAWETAKPPYDEWGEVNGGINRMALQTPSHTEVLTFYSWPNA